MALCSSEALTSLQQLLKNLASPENHVREEAEKTFEEMWIPQPHAIIVGLASVICADYNPTVRTLAAIMLRRVVSRTKSFDGKVLKLWNTVDVGAQSQCRQLLLDSFMKESVADVRNKISDAIAEIARLVSVHENWPELLIMLGSIDGTKPSELIKSALRILTAAPESQSNQKSQVLAAYLDSFFGHPDPTVRLASLKALHAIITCTSDDRKAAFSDIFSKIPDFLSFLTQVGDSAEDSLLEGLQAILDVADECPKLFRGVMPRLIHVLMAIANVGESLSEEIRSAAIELITTLVEVNPGVFRKQKDVLNNIVTLFLKTISENLSNGNDWYQTSPDDENEEEVLSLTAEQALDRVSIALGGKLLLPTLTAALPGMLRSSEWKHRYAALRAIANMAEGCADILADQLDDLLSMVWPAFSDLHPRVQYAACHALGQLCTDFSGLLQEKFAQQCLSSLVGLLISSNQPRVQCHAAAALINFSEGVDSAFIAPILDGLLERLVGLLSSSVLYLQEQVLATLAAFSSAAGSTFQRFVPKIIPILMGCLTNALDKSYRMLQCRALDAATMVALAVGKDAMGDFMKPLLDVMVALQQADLPDDDMMLDYLEPSWVRMCQTLGAEFSPFISLVLPRLLSQAAAEADVAVIDAADPNAEDEYDHSEWDFATVKGRRLGIHTATLENKCAAVENLSVYIATLQASFAPFAQQTFATILPLVSFKMHEGVQCAAAEALASLVKVAVDSSQSSPARDETIKQYLLPSLAVIFTELVSEDSESLDPEVTVSLLDGLADIFNAVSTLGTSSNMYPEGTLKKTFGCVNGYLTILVQRRSVATHRGDSEDDEDDEEEDYTDDDDESIMYAISRLSAALFKSFGASALNESETLLQFCLQSIIGAGQRRPTSNNLNLFKHASLCILDDLVHWCGDATLPIHEHISKCFKTALEDEDPDCRQAAAFGIGMCSEHAPSVYESLCIGKPFKVFFQLILPSLRVGALPCLLKLFDGPNSKAPSVITVSDNAMSAVTRICRAFPSKVDLSNILPRWVTGLPVTHDDDEAPIVYSWLLELLGSGTLAPQSDHQQGAKILHALVEALIKECLPKPLHAQTQAAIAALQQQLPAHIIQTAVAGFAPEQLSKLSACQ